MVELAATIFVGSVVAYVACSMLHMVGQLIVEMGRLGVQLGKEGCNAENKTGFMIIAVAAVVFWLGFTFLR